MRAIVSPSILSADFGRLNEDIATIEKYADRLHIDVMDGHFVPNITFGPVVVKHIKTKLPMDVHLMIDDPLKFAKDFGELGVRSISFHAELFEDDVESLKEAIEFVRSQGVFVGLALNPDKPIDLILPVLELIDYVLIMSVYAGFAGQDFMPDVLQKIKDLREKFDFTKEIQIDGGMNDTTARYAKEAGADVIISGSYIFASQDRKKAIDSLR